MSLEKSITYSKKRTSGRTNLVMLILTALFAALTAVGAWISIPLPFTAVPITLATMLASLAGGLLGPWYGALSQVIYLLLGAAGVPVFHNMTGGVGILAGPTGGYLVGYITSALLCGILMRVFCHTKTAWWGIAISSLVGLASCYVLGTIWFIRLSGTGLAASMAMCVIPFLPGDALKTIAIVLLLRKLKPALSRTIQRG